MSSIFICIGFGGLEVPNLLKNLIIYYAKRETCKAAFKFQRSYYANEVIKTSHQSLLQYCHINPLSFFQRQSDADYDYPEQDESEAALGLPSDSRSIRDNIVDEFTCDGRPYGYYADVANECQIFHICYPVTYADGEEEMFKWSFICPNGTIFDQVSTKII